MAAGDSRRSSGAAMESARRASGAAIAADLRALSKTNTEERKLRTLSARGAQPAKRGRADWKAPAATGTGGGIASPLTETSYASREYWGPQSITSVDGLLTFRVLPIKQLTQADADDVEIKQIYAEPV